VVLVKPQFEYDRLAEFLDLSKNFNGIVSENDRIKIIRHITEEIKNYGLNIKNWTESDIKGTKGNTEYLFEIEPI
ncbi:MAG TPA: TlyA family RNA methyltransferase, partial [Spirochaetota bacterium]|nr:TlyA family RNA methyltransferase [Spirochaetota bacterium]